MNQLTVITCLLNIENKIFKTYNSLLPLLTKSQAKWIIKYAQNIIPKELVELTKFNENIKIIAENDSSIYEGLNQALNFVETKYFMVLGCGDTLTTNATELINKYLCKNDFDALFFSVLDLELNKINKTNLKLIDKCVPHHQGTILNTEKCKKIGKFNTFYEVVSDYDLTIRYLKIFKNILCIDEIICNFEGGGLSSLSSLNPTGMLETYLVRLKHFDIKIDEFLKSISNSVQIRLKYIEEQKNIKKIHEKKI
jgi:hypothetical protein